MHPYSEVEDGGWLAPRRPVRSWTPGRERAAELATYPFQGEPNCAGMWELFFPRRDEERPSARQVKAICTGCEVREQCLQYAVDHNEEGIWGGYSQWERQRLKRMGLR